MCSAFGEYFSIEIFIFRTGDIPEMKSLYVSLDEINLQMRFTNRMICTDILEINQIFFMIAEKIV